MPGKENFAYGLNSRAAIKSAADKLVDSLDAEFKNPNGELGWTAQNFKALDNFSPTGTKLKRFHKDSKSEFLWDYLACDDKQGIYLVAESEKATGTRDYESFPLNHDFEKLLYVFAPLHLMICHAESPQDAKRIARKLSSYARRCSSNFPSGSAFILYCRVKTGDNIHYSWQAKGQPKSTSLEPIRFK
jgi:hypothetical protein